MDNRGNEWERKFIRCILTVELTGSSLIGKYFKEHQNLIEQTGYSKNRRIWRYNEKGYISYRISTFLLIHLKYVSPRFWYIQIMMFPTQ